MPNRKLSGAEVNGTDSANTTVGHDRGASPDDVEREDDAGDHHQEDEQPVARSTSDSGEPLGAGITATTQGVPILTSTSPTVGEGAASRDGREVIILEHSKRTLPLDKEDVQEGINDNGADKVAMDSSPRPRSPKWGMPRMPGLKNTFNVTLGRATNLITKGGPTSNDVSEEMPPQTENVQVVNELQSIFEDEPEPQVTHGKPPPENKDKKQTSRSAMQGIQSMKASLRAKLRGVSSSEKLFAENENRQNGEGERTEAVESHHEECSSVGSDTPPVLSRSESAESNGATKKLDTPGFSEEQPIQENQQDPSSNDTNVPMASSTDGDVSVERRYSSPLKSLLQDATGHEHESVEEKQDDQGNIKGYEVGTDTIGDENTSESGHAKGPVAQAVSALDTAISAARLKSKLSSPSLASALKGFGWNRAKKEAVAGVPSPPSPSTGSPVDIIPSTGSAGEEEATAPTTHEHTDGAGTDDPNKLASTVQVAVFRASNLSERLGTKFGRQKKKSTLDRFVRLKLCDVSASTPTVQGQGTECRWGTKQEGYLLEIVVPPGNIPDAGVGSSKILIEVWNKAREEQGKDVLMGKTEILLAEWLGKKGWATLDPKRSQGGRVKLRVALKPGRNFNDSHYVAMQDDSGASDSEERRPVHVEVNPTSPGPDATNTLQQMEEEQQQGETAGKPTVPITEGGDDNSDRLPLVVGSFSNEDQEDDSTVSVDKTLGEQKMAATLYVGASDGEMVQEIDTGNSVVQQDGGAALSASQHLVQACVAPAANAKSSEEEEVSSAVPEKAPNGSSSNALDGLSTLESHATETEVNRREDVLQNAPVRQDEFITAPHNEVLGEQETEPRGTHMDSLPIMPAAMELHANGHTPGAGDSADVYVVNKDRNAHFSSKARDTLVALDMGGGPTTDSDVAATTATSDRRPGHTTNENSAALTIRPRETLESSGYGSYALRQTEPATHEQRDSDENSHEQDPRQETDTKPRRNTEELQSNGEGTTSEMLATLLRETPSIQMESAPPGGAQLQYHASIGSNRARKRIERAREINRRRRAVMFSSEPDRDRRSAPCGHQKVKSVQVPAAIAIQSAFRGWIARRRLRLWQRLVVRIQAAYRGHTKRREFVALTVRARRAKGEEERARARRSRMACITQELKLLLKTPAEHCLRIDELRAEASARHIQRVWRCHSRKYSCPGIECSVRDGARPTGLGKPFFTAPEISSRSDHIPTSDITLEALGRRVASRQRAKEHLRDTERQLRSSGMANKTVQDRAWQLTAAFNQSHTDRRSAGKRRITRLANFRKLQDQLLRPPKLTSTGMYCVSAKHREGSQRHQMMMDTAVDKSWNETEDPAQRDRAQRAHTLALAAAKDRGIKPWATSLPSDVGGYDDLLDIRRLVPAWPTQTVGGRGALDFVDGFIRNQHTKGESGSSTGDRKFDSDEASLWWYVYSTNGAQTSGVQQEQDGVFAELLERAKTTLKHRKEHAERDEQQHQLLVARKRQLIIDKIIHRRKVASCPSLSSLKQRVTLAQRRAAETIQALIRGYLGRKQSSFLRAEARVFGAVQALLNELRQPELEAEDTTRPLQTLGVILADHAIPTCRKESLAAACTTHE
ncbi:unnamed protein product [Ectocarpus fasciculatus]